MTMKDRWSLATAIGLPFMVMTAYLLWVWPRPRGHSLLAEIGPYVVSLLTGLPFAWGVTRRSGRWWLLVAAFVSGFVLLWIYALAVLCGVRGVCL
jgi:hypothetical protein